MTTATMLQTTETDTQVYLMMLLGAPNPYMHTTGNT